MKSIVAVFIFIFICISLPARNNEDTLLQQLNRELARGAGYDQQQYQLINSIRQQLQQPASQLPATRFAIYARLFNAYKIFHYDSAYHYARLLQQTALELNDAVSITYARIQLGFTFLSAGMYKEAEDSLSGLSMKGQPDSIQRAYYSLMARYYYDLGDYDNDSYHTVIYTGIGNNYIDSATHLMADTSFEYLYFHGLKEIKAKNNDAAMGYFSRLLQRNYLSHHELALTASTVSDIYIQHREPDMAIRLLTRAAIADIQSATKETSATFILAQLLYRQGDVQNASLCINRALADAAFYNARQRKVQVSSVLPLIEAEKLNLVEKQRKSLLTYAIVVTGLFMVVIVLIIVVLRQVKKIKAAQQVIMEARDKEHAINEQLAEAIEKLADANKIKEEYIGYFFNVNAEFFNKMERLKLSLEQKIAERRLDDIRFIVQNNINLKKEKQELLRHFDEAFLKLFPHFITAFNALFALDDRIILKEEELLNTDLRIFALMRMGIHDSEKIAHILQYSVNTINTYKTKVKNKSIVPNDQFDQQIMDIKTV